MKHTFGLFMLKIFIDVAVILSSSKSGISTGLLVGIILGAIVVAVTLSAIVSLIILRKRMNNYHAVSRRRHCEYLPISGKCIIILLILLIYNFYYKGQPYFSYLFNIIIHFFSCLDEHNLFIIKKSNENFGKFRW